jgi:hypothetical protein
MECLALNLPFPSFEPANLFVSDNNGYTLSQTAVILLYFFGFCALDSKEQLNSINAVLHAHDLISNAISMIKNGK